jgi:hypothetical protein
VIYDFCVARIMMRDVWVGVGVGVNRKRQRERPEQVNRPTRMTCTGSQFDGPRSE